jgi:hypothetical protein
MATKTISVRLEAYERLRAARRFEGESFSQVILRAEWPETTVNGSGLLERWQREGPHLDRAALDRIEQALAEGRPPEDKWTVR